MTPRYRVRVTDGVATRAERCAICGGAIARGATVQHAVVTTATGQFVESGVFCLRAGCRPPEERAT